MLLLTAIHAEGRVIENFQEHLVLPVLVPARGQRTADEIPGIARREVQRVLGPLDTSGSSYILPPFLLQSLDGTLREKSRTVGL